MLGEPRPPLVSSDIPKSAPSFPKTQHPRRSRNAAEQKSFRGMSKSTRAAPRAAFRSPASGQRDRPLRRALTAAIVLIMILAAVACTSSTGALIRRLFWLYLSQGLLLPKGYGPCSPHIGTAHLARRSAARASSEHRPNSVDNTDVTLLIAEPARRVVRPERMISTSVCHSFRHAARNRSSTATRPTYRPR